MRARNSRVTSTEVIYGFWLVFDEDGSVRLTRTEPAINRSERAMFCEAKLPRSLWQTPALRARLNVQHNPEGGYAVDLEIAADALRQALGIDVELKVIES